MLGDVAGVDALHHEMIAMTKPRIVRPMPHLPASRSGLAPPPVTLSLATSSWNWSRRADDIVPVDRLRRHSASALGGVHLVHLTIS